MTSAPLRILVVDDSAVVRRALSRILSQDPSIGMVETAVNGEIALRKIKRFDPDVVTMDVEMPGMDGITTLQHIMRDSPRPVIMLSGHTSEGAVKTIEALELGAMDFLQKPDGLGSAPIVDISGQLLEKIKSVAPTKDGLRRRIETLTRNRAILREAQRVREEDPHSGPTKWSKPPETGRTVKVVAIGASTGGTAAIRLVLEQLPESFPVGVVIVLHMPETFTAAFAQRLNELCKLEVKEAADGDLLRPGRALVAPGHSHMVVRHDAIADHVELNRDPPINGHRPSVDVLFFSVAEVFGAGGLGILLTGMGRDGATALGALRSVGGMTIAQDQQSSVVFGMPKAAIAEGAAELVRPLHEIPGVLLRLTAVGR